MSPAGGNNVNADTCKTCPWKATENEWQQTMERGVCRRHAPVIVVFEGELLTWPPVNDDDWCGEHPARKVAV